MSAILILWSLFLVITRNTLLRPIFAFLFALNGNFVTAILLLIWATVDSRRSGTKTA